MSDQPDLDHRDHLVGRVLVKADRQGPYQFWRAGVEVPCVCDGTTGITCEYHAERGSGYTESPR